MKKVQSHLEDRTPVRRRFWVMNADGTNPTNLTDNPGIYAYLAWSPEGTKIAFQGNRGGSRVSLEAV